MYMNSMFEITTNGHSLRKDKRALEELREKLFLLWGNLEELKLVQVPLPLGPADSKKLSNRPFECCIQEYGYFNPHVHEEESNCQRLYRMCGTTIVE
jgi:protection of telomeres protein 1